MRITIANLRRAGTFAADDLREIARCYPEARGRGFKPTLEVLTNLASYQPRLPIGSLVYLLPVMEDFDLRDRCRVSWPYATDFVPPPHAPRYVHIDFAKYLAELSAALLEA